MTFTPTAEQDEILKAYLTGDNLVIQAGAGTGKTSTLRLIAEADPARRGTYIAFNRAIADEAKASFPRNIKAGTAHSLAFQAVGKQYAERLRGPRQWPREVARILGLRPFGMVVHGDENRTFSEKQLARWVKDMVGQFCRTADPEIGAHHFPLTDGLDGATLAGRPKRGAIHNRLGEILLPYAQKMWADLQQERGQFKFEHDHYLKMYQMSNPKIDGDFLLFDEAQDANPVIAAIVEAQTHLQVILVGDSAQAIYGFTGAVDAMAKFAAQGTAVRTLSQSFRFGYAVADVANVFLDALDAPLRLEGFGQVPSVRKPLDLPGGQQSEAILCRTNAGCLGALMGAQEQGRKAALVGGSNEIVKFIEAARDLQEKGSTEHPDLMAFVSWPMVEQYVAEEETTGDLAKMVKMIGKYGVEPLLRTLGASVKEKDADVIISTAHKSKGREWDHVRITDFTLDVEESGPADLMLAYVAVTRAKITLDVGTLGTWLDEFAGTSTAKALVAETVAEAVQAEPETVEGVVEVPEAVAVSEAQSTEQHFVVDVTDPESPKVGMRYTFAEDCDRWIQEHGVAGRTYRVGTATVTISPIVLL